MWVPKEQEFVASLVGDAEPVHRGGNGCTNVAIQRTALRSIYTQRLYQHGVDVGQTVAFRILTQIHQSGWRASPIGGLDVAVRIT